MSNPQIVLHLFHGRPKVDQHIDYWGTDGPRLLVDYVHITYMATMGIGTAEDNDIFFFDDGLFYYDGVYYGDFDIEADIKHAVPFDFSKARRPQGRS